MFIPTAWHRLPRSTDRLFRGIARPIPLQRHAPLQTSILRLRAPQLVRKFHATDFFSATHSRSTMRPPRRDSGWPQSPGPWQRWVQRLNSIPPNYLLFGILGVNGAVLAAWSYVQAFKGVAWEYRPPSVRWLTRWLQNNFMNNYENLREGRLWTLVTSTFSHGQPGHAFFNGLTFYFLAPTVLAALGNAQFLALYLGSGTFASLVSLAWNKERNYQSQGASGAIYALASLFTFAAPRTQFLLFFVVPMPAWACIGGIACFDVYNAFTHQFPGLDSAGHIGGLTAGALYWIMRTRFRLF